MDITEAEAEGDAADEESEEEEDEDVEKMEQDNETVGLDLVEIDFLPHPNNLLCSLVIIDL